MTYNPILPSSLLDERQEMDLSFSKQISENTYLRLGVVIEIIDPSSDKNLSKFMTEYNVMTVEDDNTAIYKNCIATDSFGSIADYCVAQYRTPDNPKKVTKSGNLQNQEGSIVLLLCMDGSSEQGVIIGSIQHPSKQVLLSKEKGQHLEGEYNGVFWEVNKDGEFTIKFKSKTDSKGKPQDTKAGGSFIKIDKTGSVDLNDGNKENIKIDKTNKTIAINAEKDITSTTSASFNVVATKDVSLTAKGKLIIDATGSATIQSKAAFNIEAKGALTIKAPSAQMTIDGQVTIKGSSVLINAPSIMLGTGGTPAVTMMTQFLGIGNLGGPVISSAIGPFSPTVFL